MGKIIGAVLIFISVLYITLNIHLRPYYKLREIKDLKQAMIIFYSYMEFSTLPLPTIFREIAGKAQGIAKELFNEIINTINENCIKDINIIWCTSIDKTNFSTQRSREILKDMGAVLGKLDKRLQLKAIDLAIKALEDKEELYKEVIKKNSSLYLRIGAMLGILIIILFI